MVNKKLLTGKIAVICHIYYLEHWPEIALKIRNIPVDFHLYITVPEEKYAAFYDALISEFPGADVRSFPNRGRDVAPFIYLLPEVIAAGYEIVCKIHAKRDVQGFGSAWREAMFKGVLGSRQVVEEVLNRFVEDPDLGMVGPASFYVSAQAVMCGNETNVLRIWQAMDQDNDLPPDWGFFAGSVYWVRTEPLASLAEAVKAFPFEEENYQADGQIAHAVERIIGLTLMNSGFTFGLIDLERGFDQGIIFTKVVPPEGASKERIPVTLSRIVQAKGHTFFQGSRDLQPGRPNILLVAHKAGQKRFGGEHSFLDMLKGAADLNLNVYACLPEASGDYLNQVLQYTNGVITFAYDQWNKDKTFSETTVSRFSHIYHRYKIDLVHCNTIMIREARVAARRCGVPAAVHVREIVNQDPDLVKLIGADSPEAIINNLTQTADYIIANSETTAASYSRPECTYVLPNTVDLDVFDIPNHLGSYINVIMLSSNIPKKGLSDFVELATLCSLHLPRVRFLLFGQYSNHIDKILQQKKSGQIPDNIFYLGYRENPVDAIGEGNIVVNFSSFAESFGRTILEAMAARRPVIVYERGALPELVEDGKNGYVIPFKKIEAAVPLLEKMTEDPTLLQNLGENGRARAVAHYNREQYRDKLARIYSDIFKEDISPQGRRDSFEQDRVNPGVFSLGSLALEEENVGEKNVNLVSSEKQGISIIVLKDNLEDDLSTFFTTFAEHNSYHPFEFLIVDHDPSENIDQVAQKWSSTLPIRYMKCKQAVSPPVSQNIAAGQARYPLILFLSKGLRFTTDILPLTAAQLQDQNIGAVGVRIDDDPQSLDPGEKPAVQHVGVKFAWDRQDQFYRPLPLRPASPAEADKVPDGLYPALGGAFLLCRKEDFLQVGGFYAGYHGQFAEVDFCLQLGFKLQKRSLCINSVSLQHTRLSAELKEAVDPAESREHDQVNIECFKARVNEQIARNQGTYVIEQPGKSNSRQIKTGLVVCIHDALEDVKRCLESVLVNTVTPYHLYLVNDGSEPETTAYLRKFAEEQQVICTLLENETALGYTRAANRGLQAAEEDYIVLLNSDTIVPRNWLEPLLNLGESDPRIGVLGPLSNSASYQSVPKVKSESGDWMINQLPAGFSVDQMAELVSNLSEKLYPRVPFINGFCYMIKRQVIETIGYFDEENFPVAYGEENDYSLRVRKAGFTLAIADDAYVYHALSKSYSLEKRRELSKAGRRALEAKHGSKPLLADIAVMEEQAALLNRLRERLLAYLTDSKQIMRPLKVLWLLIGHGGGGGGAHCIVTEALALNQLPNVFSEVAVMDSAAKKCLAFYPAVPADLFYFFKDEEQLIKHAQSFDVVVATHFKTFTILEKIYYTRGAKILPAYYVQDYEPWIIAQERKELIPEAERTYTALPELLQFAKTRWLCDLLWDKHRAAVRQVVPSLDTELYNMGRRKVQPHKGALRITAMVRPHTPRRAPKATMLLLQEIKRRFGEQVHIIIFGNEPKSDLFKALPQNFDFENRGLLERSEVADLLAETDIFVDLSTFQAFGLTAIEAMAVGCAAVLPREGGVHEFAVHEQNALIIDSTSMEEARNALSRLVKDDQLRSYLASNAARVSERFNMQAAAWSEADLMRRELNRCAVTVVVAVYNAHSETMACLESLANHTHGPHRVIVIDDCSSDPAIWPDLKAMADQYGWQALHNEENLGYTATVNKGCSMAEGDVVLLNSDTLVTENWLEKMRRAAYSRPGVATVTPLSNAAGAFSLPENNCNNPLPEGLTLEQVAGLVEREAPHLRPEVPTGNGFCLYIRREALDQVGLFDQKAFPRGYGEENDFCQRAIAAGFVNIIDDATFIFHHRTASFKDSKAEIVAESSKVINERWPNYSGQVKTWLSNDPLDPFRGRLREKIAEFKSMSTPSKRLLYVHHAGGGGVPLTNRDLLRQVSCHHECYLLITGKTGWALYRWSHGQEKLIKDFYFKIPWRIQDNLDQDRLAALKEVVDLVNPDLVHVRHFLANHPAIIDHFKSAGVPVVFSFHDYYTLCPTIQLVDNRGVYCAGYCNRQKDDCGTDGYWFKQIPPLKNDFLLQWRETVASSLSRCDAYVVTSLSTRSVLQQHYTFLHGARIELIEHGRNLESFRWISEPPRRGEPMRLVIFGALGRNKGVELIKEILDLQKQGPVPFHIDFLGTVDFPFNPKDYAHCKYHGPYKRDQLPGLLAGLEPALALIPSTCPETYCHTLTEAWASGLPVLGSNLGAVGERINRQGGGWTLDPCDAAAWIDKIADLAASPEEYERKREEIKQMRFKTTAEMARQYLELYLDLVKS